MGGGRRSSPEVRGLREVRAPHMLLMRAVEKLSFISPQSRAKVVNSVCWIVISADIEAELAASEMAACHMSACMEIATAMKYGRGGPRTVLKPAHPIENAFSMICSRQHEEDSKPATVHSPVRTKTVS